MTLITFFHLIFLLVVIITPVVGFALFQQQFLKTALDKRSSLLPLNAIMVVNAAVALILGVVFSSEAEGSILAVTYQSLLIWGVGIFSGFVFWHLREGSEKEFTRNNQLRSVSVGLILFGLSILLGIFWPKTGKLEISPQLQQIATSIPALLAMLFIVTNAAIAEELIFRLGLQSLLQKRVGAWGAILLTSTIFMFGHMGMIAPLGYKETQIFLVSIAFGLLRNRYGIFSSIIAHAVFNASATVLQLILTTTNAGN